CARASPQRTTDLLEITVDYFPAAARAEGLKREQGRAVAHEAHGAVDEGEVSPARVAAAEGAGPVEKCGDISVGPHFVVDRHGGMERDTHRPHVRNETPHPQLSHTTSSRAKNELEAVELRIPMVALAEEERVTFAVGDVRQTDNAVDVEDAVPAHVRKVR